MANRLENALREFVAVVQTSFTAAKGEADPGAGIRLLITDDQLLIRLIDTVEQKREFVELEQATTAQFLAGGEAEAGLTLGNGAGVTEYENLFSYTGTYFRQSGFYEGAFTGNFPPESTLLESYVDAFTRSATKMTYLAPLQLVSLASDSLDCGDFELRRFKADELRSMLRFEARRLFYPYALVDPDELAQHWFVYVSEDVPRQPLGQLVIRVPAEWQFPTTSVLFPAALRRVLRYLALYEWHKGSWAEEVPVGHKTIFRDRVILTRPRAPFFLSLSDSLIDWPDPCPNLTNALGTRRRVGLLQLEPSNLQPFQFSSEETASLGAFMREISRLVESIEAAGSPWSFVSKALDFLWMGYSCEGVDQLLWYVTAIEAALGERLSSGLTTVLCNRASAILGSTPSARKRFRKYCICLPA